MKKIKQLIQVWEEQEGSVSELIESILEVVNDVDLIEAGERQEIQLEQYKKMNEQLKHRVSVLESVIMRIRNAMRGDAE